LLLGCEDERALTHHGLSVTLCSAKQPLHLRFHSPKPTLALDIPCFLATCRSDIPERRSPTTCSRSISRRARPIRRPSNFALRIPARTLSTINDRSNSAIAETMTIIARPSGPPVSIFSRKLTNSMSNQRRLLSRTTSLLISPRASNNCFPSADQSKSKILPDVN
jgi:hypothetical protein